MPSPTIDPIRQRLTNQKLTRTTFRDPADVVSWLGAAQAQDYAGAKWGIGQRTSGSTDAAVERACDEGAILRTHVMRPTWHFVTPADIRWMLALTAPRVKAAMAYYDRQNELDDKVFARSHRVLERALSGGRQLTRSELASALGRAGITAKGPRLGQLMMRAELDALICSGARRGNQSTYALLEERAPRAKALKRDEALAELTRRYFSSHGPATLKDYVWWSGLTVREARIGIEMVKPVRAVVGDLAYWFVPAPSRTLAASGSAHLLPNYDEYLIAYKDRALFLEAAATRQKMVGRRDPFPHHLVIDGRLAGCWTKTLQGNAIRLDIFGYGRVSRRDASAIEAAASRYAKFLNADVTSRWSFPAETTSRRTVSVHP